MALSTVWLPGKNGLFDTASDWTAGVPANGSGDYAWIGYESTADVAALPASISGYNLILMSTAEVAVSDLDSTTFGPGMNVVATYGAWDVPATVTILDGVQSSFTNDGVIGVSSVNWLAGNALTITGNACNNLSNNGEIYSSGSGSDLIIQSFNRYTGLSEFVNNGAAIAVNGGTITVDATTGGTGAYYLSGQSALILDGQDSGTGAIAITNSTLEFSPSPTFVQPNTPATEFAGEIYASGTDTFQINDQIGTAFALSTSEVPGSTIATITNAAGTTIADLKFAGAHGAASFTLSHTASATDLILTSRQ
jgi:hypothetical protein